MFSPWTRQKELILFCDESVAKGPYFSNFYGGVLVGSGDYQRITDRVAAVKRGNKFFSEIKWSKVTELFLDSYRAVMDAFFDEIERDALKVRIMFRQNAEVPGALNARHSDNRYFLLYYQFIKHAFQLEHLPRTETVRRLRIYFDQLPDTKEKAKEFKSYILKLQDGKFKAANLFIDESEVTEVRSHDHAVLQCLDVVLGAMAFRLNDMHKEKNAGKRTKAKMELYRHILDHIVRITGKKFNIGVSTAPGPRFEARVDLPYAHWKFRAADSRFDTALAKPRKKNNPGSAY